MSQYNEAAPFYATEFPQISDAFLNMRNRIAPFILPVIILLPQFLLGQDSISTTKTDSLKVFNLHQEPVARKPFGRMLIVPAVLIGYGAATFGIEGLKNVNTYLNKQIYPQTGRKAVHLDNYLLYVPTVLVYGLNIAGVKGKNNLVDRSAILLMSNVIMTGVVYTTKNLAHEWRPDGSDRYSFPSGHTAAAFAAAEFMRREYQDVSIWYGVAGYAVAATTGYLRMYNNKHWFSDVLAGAGVGILSTDLAYYIYPSVKKVFTKKKTAELTMIMPTYQQGVIGASFVHIF